MKTSSIYGFRQSRLAPACIIALAWIVVLASCASPASGGGEGNLTIYVSGSGSESAGSSKAIAIGTLNTFSYDVQFSGPNGESLSGRIAQGAGRLTVTLALGRWGISIQAFSEGRPVGSGDETVTVTAGSQNVNVAMYYFPVWYVDPTGDDTINPGTKTAPLKTVAHALFLISDAYANGDWSNNGGDNPAPARIVISGTVTDGSSPNGLVVIDDTSLLRYPPIILEGNNGALDAGLANTRVLYINNADVTLTGTLTLKGGDIGTNGGGVYFEGAGDLTITGNTLIKENDASDFGGGVYFDGTGDFTMSGNAVIGGIGNGNTAGTGGGGVVVNDGNFIMKENAKINGNSTTGHGGGVLVVGAVVNFTMKGGTISDNEASDGGGGVFFNSAGDFTMAGGTISDNVTIATGGGVLFNSSGNFAMTGGTISDNEASDGGGVIVSGSVGNFTMAGGTISSNDAGNNGGGVFFNSSGNFAMTGGTISGNSADTFGGGVYSIGNFAMTGGTISGNVANNNGGGGVFVDTGGTFIKSGNSIIYGDNDHDPGSPANTALFGDGHAVYVLDGSKKRNNTAWAGDNLNSSLPSTAGGWEP